MAYVTNAEATPAYAPRPATVDPTRATDPPAKLDLHDKSKISAAAHRAKRLFPGPVGECLSRELQAYGEFGWRIDRDGLMPRLVEHIMTAVEDHR